MKPAIVMALSVAVVTGFSSMVMSCLRKGVPSRIRIIVQLVVIAALVILVDQILKHTSMKCPNSSPSMSV